MSAKAEISTLLLETLSRELEVVRAAAAAAKEGATHEDARPENQYDTRGLEQSYLAGAQTARAAALQGTIDSLQQMNLPTLDADTPIRIGALVDLEDDAGRERYFLCPAGGGTKLEHRGQTVHVLTPASPLGRALMGNRVGDIVERRARGSVRELEIVAVE